MRLNIGVFGPHQCSPSEYKLGIEVGAALARKGANVVCGGLEGMMTAVAEGAKSEGGLTIGILPGESGRDANAYIDVSLPTGLGIFRNMIIARVCDAVIAIRGGYGTLSEIAFALRIGVPVVGLHTWVLIHDNRIDPGIHVAQDPEQAVFQALKLAGNGR